MIGSTGRREDKRGAVVDVIDRHAGPHAPDQIVAYPDGEAALKLKVDRIPHLVEQELVSMGPVVVKLEGGLCTISRLMSPAGEEITPREVVPALGAERKRGGEGGDRKRLAEIALVQVTLNRHGIAHGRRPVKPKAAPICPPVIGGLPAGSGHQIIVIRILEIAPIEEIVAYPSTVARPYEPALLAPPANLEVASLGRLCLFGDDVDHAIDRIGAPESPTRTADNLDPIDILKEGVLHVPDDPSEQRRVHGPPVYENQELIRKGSIEAASRDGPSV